MGLSPATATDPLHASGGSVRASAGTSVDRVVKSGCRAVQVAADPGVPEQWPVVHERELAAAGDAVAEAIFWVFSTIGGPARVRP